MKTIVLKIEPGNIDLEKIRQAAEVIKKGGIVAFPTETVYGLAADFLNQKAIDKIFQVKKRPRDKPLTVQIEDITYLEKLDCDVSPFGYLLMSKFWPGPLTLVLPVRPANRKAGAPERPVDSEVSGKNRQSKTIGVRIPANEIARSLIKESQTPIVAPSANLSGEPAAKSADEVLKTFNGLIEMVIDSGETELGITSTVVDLSVSPYRILRAGAISEKDIRNVQN